MRNASSKPKSRNRTVLHSKTDKILFAVRASCFHTRLPTTFSRNFFRPISSNAKMTNNAAYKTRQIGALNSLEYKLYLGTRLFIFKISD